MIHRLRCKCRQIQFCIYTGFNHYECLCLYLGVYYGISPLPIPGSCFGIHKLSILVTPWSSKSEPPYSRTDVMLICGKIIVGYYVSRRMSLALSRSVMSNAQHPTFEPACLSCHTEWTASGLLAIFRTDCWPRVRPPSQPSARNADVMNH